MSSPFIEILVRELFMQLSEDEKNDSDIAFDKICMSSEIGITMRPEARKIIDELVKQKKLDMRGN